VAIGWLLNDVHPPCCDALKSIVISTKMAHPTEFESVTSAFGEWIVAFAEPIRFYPIALYATEIKKQI
jgi:hypothetical protein